ncbi:MAG: HAD-IIB family hydrolase [Pleurocapsa sp. MO_226.B13]|nr:HAD-IIB family hydrolase [Pleurocapsa sp. MO_226.B13]
MSQAVLKPLVERNWKDIRLIASDLDGTLTQSEKFNFKLFQALTQLNTAGVDVLIVTGRSAGWVQAIATYFPIVGAIAENGGLLYWNHDPQPDLLTSLNLAQHRQELSRVFELLQDKFPQLKESEDNRFRLTDWTFEVANLTETELERINLICQSEGYGFTYSTVQCHIKPLQQDKAIALGKVIPRYFPSLISEQIVTVGDSPNDESLFNPEQFPVSVGVANILKYRDRLQHLPAYVTNKSELAGFYELVELIIN